MAFGGVIYGNHMKKICVCEDCAEKLFGIKSTKTRLKEITDMLRATTLR